MAGPNQGHRQAAATAAIGARAKKGQGIGYPSHRALAQRGVTCEDGRHRGRGHSPHNQPHARTRIATIDHSLGFFKAPNPNPMH